MKYNFLLPALTNQNNPEKNPLIQPKPNQLQYIILLQSNSSVRKMNCPLVHMTSRH